MTARHLQNLPSAAALQEITADAAIISTLDLPAATKLNSLTTPMVPGDTVGLITETANADFTFADQIALGDVDLTAGTTLLNSLNFVPGDAISVTTDTDGTSTFTFTDRTVTGNVDLGDGTALLSTIAMVNTDKVVFTTTGGGATTFTATDVDTETIADMVAILHANSQGTAVLDPVTGFLTFTATDGGLLTLGEGAAGTNLDDLGHTAATIAALDVDDIIAVFDGMANVDCVLDVSDFFSIIATDGGDLVISAGARWTDLGMDQHIGTLAGDTVADVVAAWNAVGGATCVLTLIQGEWLFVITATDGGLLTIDEGGQGTNLDDLGLAVETVLGFEERPKSFTVPADTEWKLQSLYAAITTDSTAGTRQFVVEYKDSSGDIIQNIILGVTQIASLTRNYTCGIGLPNLTTLVDTIELTTPLPDIWLPAGSVIRFWDNNAIDVVDDILLVRAMVQARGAV